MSIGMQMIRPADVRRSVARAKSSLEKVAEEVVWQIEVQAWVVLGYRNWNEMREAEYGEAAFMIPRKQRQELVTRMRQAGLTQEDIAKTAGVDVRTVRTDLSTGNISGSEEPVIITNSRGQERPSSYCGTKKNTENTKENEPVQVTCPTCGGSGRITQ